MFEQSRRPSISLIASLGCAFALLTAPASALAAPCPAAGSCGGTGHPNPSLGTAFHQNGTVCTTASTIYHCGGAIACGGSPMFVAAYWASITAKTMDTTGGCVVKCNAGANSCRVGNDGLPVELLQFGVE